MDQLTLKVLFSRSYHLNSPSLIAKGQVLDIYKTNKAAIYSHRTLYNAIFAHDFIVQYFQYISDRTNVYSDVIATASASL